MPSAFLPSPKTGPRRKDRFMRNPIEIEDIEAMRRQEGIEDEELRDEIHDLAVGDLVNLTFLTSPPPRSQTLLVRITRINGKNYCGELARRQSYAGLSKLRAGEPITFKASHIHSVPKGQPAHEE